MGKKIKKIWKIEWNEMVKRKINITQGIYIKLIVSINIYVYIYFIGNDGFKHTRVTSGYTCSLTLHILTHDNEYILCIW